MTGKPLLFYNGGLAKPLIAISLFAIVYFVSAKLGLTFAFLHPSATAVWPPAGIALAALIVFGYHLWPGVALGAFFANIITAGSVWTSIGIAIGSTLEAVLGAYLVNTFAGGRRAFDRPQDVLKFAALAGLASTAVSATIGITALYLGGFAELAQYSHIWLTWWLGDMGGALIVAPVLILWLTSPHPTQDRLSPLECVIGFSLLAAVGYLAFASFPAENFSTASIAFLCVPILLWIAVRLGPREASAAILLISMIALWGTLRGYGPFFRVDRNESLLLLQEIGGMIAVMILALSAAISSRNRSEQALRDSEQTARGHLAELETIYRNAPVGLGLTDRKLRFASVNEALAEIDGVAASDHIGRTLGEILPEALAERVEPLYRRVLETGEPVVNVEVQGETRAKPGVSRIWNVNYHPVRGGDNTIIGVSVLVHEITERKQVESRRHVIFAITQILADSSSFNEAMSRILETVGETLGWEAGGMWIPDSDANVLRCLKVWHHPSGIAESFVSASYESTFAPGVGLPGRVWTSLKPAWISDLTKDSNYLRTPCAVEAGLRTGFAYPILLGGKLLGVIEFYSRDTREPDNALLAMFNSVGSQVGQFIERKRAEAALRESEAKARRLLELNQTTVNNMGEGMYAIDTHGSVTYMNPEAERLFGWKPGELMGCRIHDVTHYKHPDGSPFPIEECAGFQVLRQGRILRNFEDTFIKKDGSFFPVSYSSSPFRNHDGEIAGLVIVFRDITERKQAEAALHESEERFRSLVSVITDMLWVTDASGAFIAPQRAWESYTGQTWEEHRGFGWANAFHPDDRERVKNTWQRACGSRTLYHSEGRLWHAPTQRWRHFMAKATPLLNPDGSVREWVGTCTDIDDQKRTKEQLENTVAERTRELLQANAQLLHDVEERKKLEEQLLQAQKMESIGTLAGGIAHDFNNILNIIHGYASILGKYGAESNQIGKSLAVIDETVQRGSALVQQLLTLARKSSVQFESVNANVLLEELIALISQTFPKTIELSSHLEQDLPAIMVDKNQLSQALLNLCVNARDAMPDGGKLLLQTCLVDHAQMSERFHGAQEGSYVCIRLSDTGTGMDERTRSRIFEPFFTTKPQGQGTGLGLSVVYGIVTNHSGFIDVESAPNEGTTFHIYLPTRQGEIQSGGRKREIGHGTSDGSSAGRHGTVLFVDDERNQVRLVQEFLENKGYKVLTAQDGAEALEVHQRHKDEIAVVILDLGLPKLNGWQAFERMRQLQPNLNALFTTGFLSPDAEAKMKKDQPVTVIQKPYRLGEILEKVSAAIRAMHADCEMHRIRE